MAEAVRWLLCLSTYTKFALELTPIAGGIEELLPCLRPRTAEEEWDAVAAHPGPHAKRNADRRRACCGAFVSVRSRPPPHSLIMYEPLADTAVYPVFTRLHLQQAMRRGSASAPVFCLAPSSSSRACCCLRGLPSMLWAPCRPSD